MCACDSTMTAIKLDRSRSMKNFLKISSVVKNASFSRGWLHFAIQSLFAVIIVVSFVLIVLMAMKNDIGSSNTHPIPERVFRCYSKNCVVSCDQVPYFGRYSKDIIYAISKIPNTCEGFYLTLTEPMFFNEVLPPNWLPRMALPLQELNIIGGNLMHLTADSFLNQRTANIRTLALHDLVINTWSTNSLVGLNQLEEININNCTLVNVDAHVLRSVYRTLKTLIIVNSGRFDPENITGTLRLPHVRTVVFSNNIFNDLLNKKSFIGLENCEDLYLNSCNISAIGKGTFDNLNNIETLFLNGNQLVTIPIGLFSKILSIPRPKPRINLHGNFWDCNCSNSDITRLVTYNMLLTDPTCQSPTRFKGQTFLEFASYCERYNKSTEEILLVETSTTSTTVAVTTELDDISDFVYVNVGCHSDNQTSGPQPIKILSPLYSHQCSASNINETVIQSFSYARSSDTIVSINTWMRFTFFLNTDKYSMVQIAATNENNYGLLWYQSNCPNEVYCVNVVPESLRVYNINMTARYVFCPVLNTGVVVTQKCVIYDLQNMSPADLNNLMQILLYISIGGICLVIGAICVYGLICIYPNLLKGSKRILFVKHKTVDALVLPPKVPLRNELMNEAPEFFDDKIFVVPGNTFDIGKFNRNKSIRSIKSNAPSYISALQPTDGQLAEWRIRNHFTDDLMTDQSTYTWLCNTDTHFYTDVIDTDKTYESLK